MRTVFACVLMALMSLAGCSSHRVLDTQSIPVTPDYLADRSVALVGVDDGEVSAYCSGVWVNGDTIATALHCVKDVVDFELVSYVVRDDLDVPGRVNNSLVVARDVEHDLALLKAVGGTPSHRYATLAQDGPYQGEMVQTMGSPIGLTFSYSHGDVAAVRYLSAVGRQDKMLFVQTTAPISPGNSGGALFNAWGEVVGICHAHFTGSQNLNIFIHHNYLSALMKKVL